MTDETKTTLGKRLDKELGEQVALAHMVRFLLLKSVTVPDEARMRINIQQVRDYIVADLSRADLFGEADPERVERVRRDAIAFAEGLIGSLTPQG